MVGTRVTPVTVLGPLLVTVIVYEILVPGTALVWPSLIATAMSLCKLSVSVSEAELFPGVGSVQPANVPTATDVVRLPVAEPLIVPLRVIVTVLGPLLVTVIVYEILVPGTELVWPSLIATARSL